jgi:diguanylate cyclase (GGDEF)-like protein
MGRPLSRENSNKTDRATVVEVPGAEPKRQSPRLIVVSGMLLGYQLELTDEPVIIGRASECTLALQHPSVSRQHCRIWREDGRFLIEDMGSTNKTYVNGQPVDRAELRDGDQIGVGNNAIKFFVGASMEASYHRELIDLAIYDSLTGCYNRRHFRTLLDEEVDKARNAQALSVLMLDLDHFKRVNDEHGHLVGDQVLSAVAQTLRDQCRGGTPIGRLGGEEFGIALLQTPLIVAVSFAERVCEAVAAQPISSKDHQDIPVTVSIGVAQSRPEMSDGAALIDAADEQLYRAKQSGRNRACAALV